MGFDMEMFLKELLDAGYLEDEKQIEFLLSLDMPITPTLLAVLIELFRKNKGLVEDVGYLLDEINTLEHKNY